MLIPLLGCAVFRLVIAISREPSAPDLAIMPKSDASTFR